MNTMTGEGVDFLRELIDIEAELWLKAYELGEKYNPQRLDDIKEIAEIVGIYGNQGLVLRGEKYAAEVFRSGLVFFRPLRQMCHTRDSVNMADFVQEITSDDYRRLISKTGGVNHALSL